MTQVKHGDTVKVHYTGKLDDGSVFDSSVEHAPLQFTVGDGQVIPGFEDTIIGMKPGDSKTTQIPSEQAYGPYRDEMVMVVARDQFPENLNPQVEQQLQIVHENGQAFIVQVIEVSDTDVTLDANHPLAGQDLIFEIQLVEII